MKAVLQIQMCATDPENPASAYTILPEIQAHWKNPELEP